MPDQSEAFRRRCSDGGVKQFDWYPMIRGRLVAINDEPVGPTTTRTIARKRLVDREFNLSHSVDAAAAQHHRRRRWIARASRTG